MGGLCRTATGCGVRSGSAADGGWRVAAADLSTQGLCYRGHECPSEASAVRLLTDELGAYPLVVEEAQAAPARRWRAVTSTPPL
jgi:hypothetical protein